MSRHSKSRRDRRKARASARASGRLVPPERAAAEAAVEEWLEAGVSTFAAFQHTLVLIYSHKMHTRGAGRWIVAPAVVARLQMCSDAEKDVLRSMGAWCPQLIQECLSLFEFKGVPHDADGVVQLLSAWRASRKTKYLTAIKDLIYSTSEVGPDAKATFLEWARQYPDLQVWWDAHKLQPVRMGERLEADLRSAIEAVGTSNVARVQVDVANQKASVFSTGPVPPSIGCVDIKPADDCDIRMQQRYIQGLDAV